MKRAHSEADLARTIRLLESLRATGVGPDFNIEPAVARRIRAQRFSRHWTPVISFREFVWGATVALAMLAVGAAGLVAVFSPQWLSSPSTAIQSLASTGQAVLGAGYDLGKTAVHAALGEAARLSSAAPYLDDTLTVAAQAALVACAAMFLLTVLVVSHEARGRRVIQ